MNKVAVIYSQQLADTQDNPDGGYKHSQYNAALKVYEKALDDLRIEHIRWREEELHKDDLLMQEGVKVLLVPKMRVCSDRTFIELRRRAEEGWKVFATWDSFYYKPVEGDKTKNVGNERFPELFHLTGNSVISRHCWLEKGEIRFNRTRFSWITREIPERHMFSGHKARLLALVGESQVYFPYGEIVAEQPKDLNGKLDNELAKRKLPAFMVREYPSGGMFIYACFDFALLSNFSQVLENICNYESQLALEDKQDSIRNREIARLRVSVVILTAIVFFLLARELIGDTWIAYLGGIVLGIVLGVLGNKATDALDRWLSR